VPRAPLGAFSQYLPDAQRTRHIAGAVAAIAAIALAIGVVVGVGSSRGASKPAKAAGASAVQRRDLVQTDTEAGTLSYANAQTAFNRLSGTITWLPSVGDVVKPGGVLYRVDGNPVVLMDGGLPAYRDLSEGVTDGPDVEELKQNLKNLGFNPGTVNQTFDAATTSAVDAWQASLGQSQTGTVTLGQVVFLPGARRITSVVTSLGSTGGTSGSAGGSAGSSSSGGTAGSGSTSTTSTTTSTASITPAPHAQYVSLTTGTTSNPTPSNTAVDCGGSGTTTTPSTATTTTPSSNTNSCSSSRTNAQTLAALTALLKAETAELKKAAGGTGSRSGAGATTGAAGGGARGGGGGSAAGAGAGGGGGGAGGAGAGGAGGGGAAAGGSGAQPILQTTSTQLVVTVNLDATKQSEAVTGEPVTVQLPNGNTADGKITQVSPVAQASSSSSSSGGAAGGAASGTPSATVPVTIALSGRRISGLDQAAVSVNFEQQVERGVLSVPVTALIATAGGGYAVQEATPPHRLIAVTPGLFAAGYVQISGPGVFSGLQVTDSQG